MKAPSPTFKAELVAFRQRLKSPSRYTDDPARKREFERKQKMYLEVIDRWIEHPSAEDPWTTLKAKSCELLLPGLFIAEILQRREVADLLHTRIVGYAQREKQIRTQIKRLTSETKGPAKAEKHRAAAAAHEWLADLTEARARFGRKGATAAREHFSRHLSKRLMDLTGEPLDAVTAIMVYVAFGEERATESVRKARNIHASK